jgi:hypothetical protein
VELQKLEKMIANKFKHLIDNRILITALLIILVSCSREAGTEWKEKNQQLIKQYNLTERMNTPAALMARTCDGRSEKLCGDAAPSTSKVGTPTPSITCATREWMGLMVTTTSVTSARTIAGGRTTTSALARTNRLNLAASKVCPSVHGAPAMRISVDCWM